MWKNCTCWVKLSPNTIKNIGIYCICFPLTNLTTSVLFFKISVCSFPHQATHVYPATSCQFLLLYVSMCLAFFLHSALFILHDMLSEYTCDCTYAYMYLIQIAEIILQYCFSSLCMYIYIYVNPQKNRKVKSHESSDKLLFFCLVVFIICIKRNVNIIGRSIRITHNQFVW